MPSKRAPKWLTREQVEAIHEAQLGQFGGLPGLRDAGMLESALARPQHRWHYGEARDSADCAASYAFGLAKNHPFADGNKRTAFVSMATFFAWNGFLLTAPEAEAVATMIGLADGRITEKQLAVWLRANCARRPKGK